MDPTAAGVRRGTGGSHCASIVTMITFQQTWPRSLFSRISAWRVMAFALLALLSRFAADGKLVIASLHDLTLAARHADRIVALMDGKIAGDVATLTPALIRTVFGVESRISGKGSNVTVDFLAP